MATSATETTSTSDPLCQLSSEDPGHVCRRFDGRRLNGDNGCCGAWAEKQVSTDAGYKMEEVA